MSAASAVGDALLELDSQAQSQVVDSYKYAASVVSRVVSNGYLGMVKTIPQMYRFLYNRAERATEVGPLRTWINQFTAGNLRSLIETRAPDVVVCTHAFPCGAMAEYKAMFADAPPVVGIVTDFAVHAFWAHANIDAYAVATSDVRDALVARGVPGGCVCATGIPVRAQFGERSENRALLRERLGLPADRPVVLMMAGGLGIGPLEVMMRALDQLAQPLCAVVIAGRNARLEARVREAANEVRYPLRAVRFVSNVHEYMHASDVLVTKPGGLTTAEALAANVPMVLFKPLPGQEERNTRYLVERHAARRARTPADVTRAVGELLRSSSQRDGMHEAMRRLARPDAALQVARRISALCSSNKELVC